MGFIKTKLQKIYTILRNDTVKITKDVISAIDKIDDKIGKLMVEDAQSSERDEIKKTLIKNAMATLASSVASSVSGQNVSIPPDSLNGIASLLVTSLDKIELTIGKKLEE